MSATAPNPARRRSLPATAQGREIQLIHIGAADRGMSRQTNPDAYEGLMLGASAGRTTSSKDLTAEERQAVLRRLEAMGFKLPRQGGQHTPRNPGSEWRHAPKLRKLMAMWWTLADAGHVNRPASSDACRTAVEAWALGQLSGSRPALAAMRFASGAQMSELIEALKKWCVRVGVPTDAKSVDRKS